MTLVEIAVVLAILAILSGVLVNTRGAGRDQLAMIHDSALVSGLLYRAKSMTLERFAPRGAVRTVCGFGVYFNGTPGSEQVFLFGDVVTGNSNDPCKIAGVYQGNGYYDSQDVLFPIDGTYTPDARIQFSLRDGNSTSPEEFGVVFIPPDPTPTFSDSFGVHYTFPLTIQLKLKQGSLSSVISVDEVGQIIEE